MKKAQSNDYTKNPKDGQYYRWVDQSSYLKPGANSSNSDISCTESRINPGHYDLMYVPPKSSSKNASEAIHSLGGRSTSDRLEDKDFDFIKRPSESIRRFGDKPSSSLSNCKTQSFSSQKEQDGCCLS